MTLTNPTDDQLNAAFADMVAGWTVKPLMSDPLGLFISPDGKHWQAAGLPFTHSADAVLPWLITMQSFRIEMPPSRDGEIWVMVWPDMSVKSEGVPIYYRHTDKSLSRAIVIALLRSRGVEVEFDK